MLRCSGQLASSFGRRGSIIPSYQLNCPAASILSWAAGSATPQRTPKTKDTGPRQSPAAFCSLSLHHPASPYLLIAVDGELFESPVWKDGSIMSLVPPFFCYDSLRTREEATHASDKFRNLSSAGSICTTKLLVENFPASVCGRASSN